jgi:hypothetical protein
MSYDLSTGSLCVEIQFFARSGEYGHEVLPKKSELQIPSAMIHQTIKKLNKRKAKRSASLIAQ